ncbi:hypothetical protein GCM10028777_24200 [Angustibacter speluncae]
MTTSPFGAPSSFGSHAEPEPADAVTSSGSGGRSRVVLYSLGGVAAVAAVGAGAFFMLGGQDEAADDSAAPPAPVTGTDELVDEPAVEQEQGPVLVTAASRNPFAAQVLPGGGGAAATAPETQTSSSGGGTSAGGGSSSGGSSSGGSSSGGSGSSAESAAIDAALVAEIERLQNEISGIQTQIKQLQTAGGGKSNQAQVDALQARLDSLTSQLQDLVGALPVTVVFTSAAGDATTNSAVFSTSSGGVIANFDPVSEGQEITSGGGAQGTGITYLDGVDLDANGTVDMAKLSYGGLVYRVYLGEAVLIHVG